MFFFPSSLTISTEIIWKNQTCSTDSYLFKIIRTFVDDKDNFCHFLFKSLDKCLGKIGVSKYGGSWRNLTQLGSRGRTYAKCTDGCVITRLAGWALVKMGECSRLRKLGSKVTLEQRECVGLRQELWTPRQVQGGRTRSQMTWAEELGFDPVSRGASLKWH